ncbi:hypothetical protein H9L10_03640 [Phycicoccus endophyticus]|uniref:Helix-turn-helix domain-containing protein n=1 Tax=Phycicoccus endophyticus TaxID=1690220 RepID=A0A7G9R3I7_9MICO|nr:hypothetical protein [Phycicoccus endophyticus]NHI19918.1 hypothetical protein [Phycicoccus endophyticus]QNN50162.1 hypothetical protein H9L10_03640 [Phycicoccus endophyticus]GGL27546.1 hypothetical protein GCM10012283_07160 [Phycicoccus endophyticus]
MPLMARIRTIKPTFWGDDKVAKLTRDERLLFLGLVSMADDEGRFLASNAAVAGFVFPNDELSPARIGRWMKHLDAVGLIRVYDVGSVRYGVLPKFTTHQVINRKTKSVLPEPPPETLL